MMGADPDWFIQKKLAKTKQGLEFFGKEALAEYMRCFRDPETIHAMVLCEDYRATFRSPGPGCTRRLLRRGARSRHRKLGCGARLAASAEGAATFTFEI